MVNHIENSNSRHSHVGAFAGRFTGVVSIVGLLTFFASTFCAADTSFQHADQSKAVGNVLSGSFQAGIQDLSPSPVPSSASTAPIAAPVAQAVTASASPAPSTGVAPAPVISTAGVEILGAIIQALSALIQPDNTINGTTYTEFYAFGKRVFSDTEFLNAGTSSVSVSAGLSPAEVRVPLVKYPIGPIIVGIDGGARFQADASVQLVPEIAVPIQYSTLGAQLSADLDVAGFIEGYASFLIVRAGVGGQVDLVDANATVNARLGYMGGTPFVDVTAWADFLSGEFYAFVDYFNILSFKFKRLLNYNLFQWKGDCFATENAQCSPN